VLRKSLDGNFSFRPNKFVSQQRSVGEETPKDCSPDPSTVLNVTEGQTLSQRVRMTLRDPVIRASLSAMAAVAQIADIGPSRW
jgi:hypothetical protein